VVVDPDFAGGTVDKYVRGSISTDYATARTSSSYDSDTGDLPITHRYNGANSSYYIFRSYLVFDTSSIDDGATVTQANLKLRCIAKGVPAGENYDIDIVKLDWSGLTREQAYDGALSADLDDSIWKNVADIAVNNTYISGNLSTTWVSKTGSTYYALICDADRDGTPAPTGYWEIYVGSANNATEAYRPVLTVTYAAPGGFHPINMNANMSNLTAGMRG
jgi:hypothetical protein